MASEDKLREFFIDPPSSLDTQPDLKGSLASSADVRAKFDYLGVHFFHPHSSVRLEAIKLCVPIDAHGFNYFLVNALADDDAKVRKAAAEALWERDGEEFCKYAVKSLRDELRSYTSDGFTTSEIGPEQAKQALTELVDAAPTQEAKDGVQRTIREEIGSL